MYQELLPLQERLAEELRETVAAQVLPGMDPEKLLKAYIGQLTLHIGVDVSNKTVSRIWSSYPAALTSKNAAIFSGFSISSTLIRFRPVSSCFAEQIALNVHYWHRADQREAKPPGTERGKAARSLRSASAFCW